MSYLKACDIEINPQSVADYWSPTSQQLVALLVAGKFQLATGRRSSADFRRQVGSATSWQSFGDLCNQFSRSQSSVHVQKTARD